MHQSAWKVNSANYFGCRFYEIRSSGPAYTPKCPEAAFAIELLARGYLGTQHEAAPTNALLAALGHRPDALRLLPTERARQIRAGRRHLDGSAAIRSILPAGDSSECQQEAAVADTDARTRDQLGNIVLSGVAEGTVSFAEKLMDALMADL